MTALLPCPFCGGKATVETCTGDSSVRDGKPFYWVQHVDDGCPISYECGEVGGMETGYYSTAAEAAAAWNRRAP
jgi:hypothetical protein